MNTKPFDSAVARVAEGQWHLLEDGVVTGRGHCMRRPDGRLFVSIDAWRSAAFGRLAEAMLSSLPAPLYTVVGEAGLELTANWQRAGFTIIATASAEVDESNQAALALFEGIGGQRTGSNLEMAR